jgi:SAM-dependent methyltransferase
MAPRRRQPEVMDQPGLDPARHAAALRGLGRLNALSASARLLWHPLARLAGSTPHPLRVLDLASGGGDVLIRLWRQATRLGVALAMEGCDVSPMAVEFARAAAARAGAPVRFFVHDALACPPGTDYDAVTCSLFLHHLDEAGAVTLLRNMAAAGRLVLLHDLERGPLGWLLAWGVSRLVTRCDVVHADGPVSVAGAFTAGEVRELARRAGLGGAVVTRHWPCRLRLLWRRP